MAKLLVFETVVDSFKRLFKHIGTLLMGYGAVLGASLVGLTIAGVLNIPLVKGFYALLPQLKQLKMCGADKACQEATMQLLQGPIVELLKNNWLLVTISAVFLGILFTWIQFGYTNFVLHVHDTGAAIISDLFPAVGKFIKLAIASVIFFVLVAAGLVALVLPGIYLMLRFGFFIYAILDRDAGIIDSLKQSWAMTQGNVWSLLGLTIIAGLINTLNGFIPLLFLLTLPMVSLMYACAYRQLGANHTLNA
jgi:hypothetical protein